MPTHPLITPVAVEVDSAEQTKTRQENKITNQRRNVVKLPKWTLTFVYIWNSEPNSLMHHTINLQLILSISFDTQDFWTNLCSIVIDFEFFVKNNFSHVTLGIIVFSVLPIIFEIIKARKEK